MGGEIGSTTILRGFRVSVEALDAFLAANGVDETYGYPPWHRKHPDNDNVSKLLYKFIANTGSDADKDRFRVMIPAIPGSTSQAAYVTYAWVTVLAHREIDMEKDLPAEVPAGFESLRREILSFGDGKAIKDEGKMGVFAVVTHGFPGIYTPKEYLDRGKVSLTASN